MLSVFFQTEESLVTAYGVCHIVGKYLLYNEADDIGHRKALHHLY